MRRCGAGAWMKAFSGALPFHLSAYAFWIRHPGGLNNKLRARSDQWSVGDNWLYSAGGQHSYSNNVLGMYQGWAEHRHQTRAHIKPVYKQTFTAIRQSFTSVYSLLSPLFTSLSPFLYLHTLWASVSISYCFTNGFMFSNSWKLCCSILI